MTSSCETIPSSADPPHPATARRMEFVGVFLDTKSQDALKARFQALHGDTSAQSSLVLKYNPSKEELDAFAPIMGKNVKIQAVAQDEHAQAAIASVSTEHGDVNYAVECPHITVSVTGEDGCGLHYPFPPTNASLTILADDALELTGVLCTSSTYDAATHSCGPPPKKAECGFCLFMKAGPCGEQFTTWEACLDQSKKEGSDFLTKCGPQTLALRDCVDANPEYYSVLNGDSNDDDEAPNDV
ncbi:hypothetical protein DYB32_005823 [Aphanomyces invadans]|uniref:GCK domain-containing protein n=1 Tax=Aphanomyces invadans TaxID=157072 RepID=A0A3R6Z2U2_9STRA|nr:hypothetical protein DYB32_005823 [Aphanomyces invadans]